jgi:hypothetical protein
VLVFFTRLAAASDKVYQLLARGRWFSPASSTTKTGRHDIAEILLKEVSKHQKSKKVIELKQKSFDRFVFVSLCCRKRLCVGRFVIVSML